MPPSSAIWVRLGAEKPWSANRRRATSTISSLVPAPLVVACTSSTVGAIGARPRLCSGRLLGCEGAQDLFGAVRVGEDHGHRRRDPGLHVPLDVLRALPGGAR